MNERTSVCRWPLARIRLFRQIFVESFWQVRRFVFTSKYERENLSSTARAYFFLPFYIGQSASGFHAKIKAESKVPIVQRMENV